MSTFLCEFQGLFAHYCVYLSSFGVIALALYRLACVYISNLNHLLSLNKLILVLVIIWLLPILIILVPKIWLKVPITYNDRLLTCRMNFGDHTGYFLFYILFANLLPSVSVGIFYFLIILKIRRSKRRIMNSTHGSTKVACTASSAHTKPLNIFQAVYEINNQKEFEEKIRGTKVCDILTHAAVLMSS